MRISIEGNIGSGKSTLLEALRLARPDANIVPEPLHAWGGLLELYYTDPGAWSLPLHLRILHEFWKITHTVDSMTIVERSPGACRHVFGQLSYNDNHLTPAAWDVFKEYHELLGWEPDAYVYVDTPLDVCCLRMRERGRACESTVSEEYLRRIEFQYQNFLKFCRVPVIRVDGTLPPDEIAFSILAALCVKG